MEKIAIENEHVKLLGRTEKRENIIWLCTAGAGVAFCSNASSIYAELKGILAEGNELPENTYAYIGVFINAKEQPVKKIKVSRKQSRYLLCENKERKTIQIKIIKLTEAQYDKVGICALYADGKVQKAQEGNSKILFIGDSITAGYGVLGKDGISEFTTADEDVTKAYAYITAEKLKADCQIFAWSGNGLLSRWIPPEEDTPAKNALIPEIFPYTDVSLSETLHEKRSIWRKEEFVPDLIVCNLGTNDASYTREIPIREQQFKEAYRIFLENLRQMYPQAAIMLACGLMETTLNGAIQEVAEETGAFFLPFSQQEKEMGLGTAGHPGVEIQRKTAETLITAIQNVMAW